MPAYKFLNVDLKISGRYWRKKLLTNVKLLSKKPHCFLKCFKKLLQCKRLNKVAINVSRIMKHLSPFLYSSL